MVAIKVKLQNMSRHPNQLPGVMDMERGEQIS